MMKRYLPALALACLVLTPAAAGSQEGPDAALTAAREGRTAEALRRVDAALAADPADPRALLTRGVILAESGRRDEAEKTFRRLIAHHPELPEAYNNLAVIQAADLDFDGAVSTLKAALATNPTYRTAYENLTRIFAQLASEAYSRALEVESPPAREQVELEMLATLSAPPPMAGALIAGREAAVEPAMPMPKPAAEEPAADETESASGTARGALEPIEGEDLGAAEMTEPPAPTPAASAETPAMDLADLVDEWAQAWSEQRVDDYLSFYAAEFLPDNGMTRSAWEANRRERIAAPEYIKVDVAILDSMSETADRAKVTFLQAYESNTYRDQVTKTLTLVRDGSAWKILEEKSGS